MPETSHFDVRVDAWLNIVKISDLSEWDVLIFFYRHGTSLASAENIALLLGYSKSVVGKALDALGILGVVQRSRSSQRVRLYRFILPPEAIYQESLKQLLELSETRSGRLIVIRRLRQRAKTVPAPARSGWRLA